MATVLTRREDCRLCGSRDLQLVLHLAATPVGADYLPADRLQETQEIYPIDLFLCNQCSYVGFLDIVPPEALFNDSAEVTSRSLGVVENLRNLADTISSRIDLTPDSLVVDIGSNDGTLLKFFQGKGMRVLGFDPSTFVADMAAEAGVPTVPERFTIDSARSAKEEWGPAKVITANRVIANIDDMVATLDGIRHFLAPDGLFEFETGYLPDILENNLFDTIYHEHLGYDTVKPLATFFQRMDMELVDVERIGLKGGSVRGFVQHRGGPWPVSDSVDKFITYEEQLGVASLQAFEDFGNSLSQTRTGLLEFLGQLKAQSKTVAGYGASVGSTTVIYHLELGEHLSLLFDDDPRNQNLFSPGHHIPVLPSEEIYEKKPDYILIVAWRYAEPIMKKHQAYLEQGGHFILPFPEIKII